jgi:hypothetical protein
MMKPKKASDGLLHHTLHPLPTRHQTHLTYFNVLAQDPLIAPRDMQTRPSGLHTQDPSQSSVWGHDHLSPL